MSMIDAVEATLTHYAQKNQSVTSMEMGRREIDALLNEAHISRFCDAKQRGDTVGTYTDIHLIWNGRNNGLLFNVRDVCPCCKRELPKDGNA